MKLTKPGKLRSFAAYPQCSTNREGGAMRDSMKLGWLLPWVILAASGAGAQDAVSPLPGALLRVTAPTLAPKPLVGTLVGITAHEVVLALSESDRRAVPRAAMTRLEWNRGRQGNAIKGLIIGAVVGAALLSALNAEDPETGDAQEYALVALVGAGLGALPGAGVGALVRTDRWAEVPVSGLHVTLGPIKGNGVAMSVTWQTR
jgi:uncharacterized membrane protein YeaQ/YmgE (transglycosylase-associated protein family)